ncbi:TetR/AcrR family transcriptional regulator [Streptomyces sp. NPDC059506]|uniref:TetR/AcrR family transcriptional regulator n=1 Tax=Streptomyces thermolineatus TaxID=44033 RepID=A0ABN3KZ14_9ACTN|nr:TetR family transcriptional regulator [Streptomyces sp. SCUT-3]QMV21762.1 TetR family transcriptional regulator [Streptomyces sp. SCUT-3]
MDGHAADTTVTATPRAARGAYRRLPVAQRREQLLAAALGLFGACAPEEVTVDAVAAAAGVSRPLVYRYFPGGRQQIYETALRSAADQLMRCFQEPAEGTPTQRLSNAVDRYLAFVREHEAGYSALLRGGSVVETTRTTAIVDDVRRGAAEEILRHLMAEDAGPRLRMTVRSWIASAEAISLTWIDQGLRPAAEELRAWLVDQFVGLLAVGAAGDEETAEVVRRVLGAEGPDSPAGDLARRLLPLAGSAQHLL